MTSDDAAEVMDAYTGPLRELPGRLPKRGEGFAFAAGKQFLKRTRSITGSVRVKHRRVASRIAHRP
jgi:hypothetical protein